MLNPPLKVKLKGAKNTEIVPITLRAMCLFFILIHSFFSPLPLSFSSSVTTPVAIDLSRGFLKYLFYAYHSPSTLLAQRDLGWVGQIRPALGIQVKKIRQVPTKQYCNGAGKHGMR